LPQIACSFVLFIEKFGIITIRVLAKLFGSGALAPPKGMRLKPHFLVLQEL